MDGDFLLGATIDDALTEPEPDLKAIGDRAAAMRMTGRELDLYFISYLLGVAPEAVERALDYVERKRNGGDQS